MGGSISIVEEAIVIAKNPVSYSKVKDDDEVGKVAKLLHKEFLQGGTLISNIKINQFYSNLGKANHPQSDVINIATQEIEQLKTTNQIQKERILELEQELQKLINMKNVTTKNTLSGVSINSGNELVRQECQKLLRKIDDSCFSVFVDMNIDETFDYGFRKILFQSFVEKRPITSILTEFYNGVDSNEVKETCRKYESRLFEIIQMTQQLFENCKNGYDLILYSGENDKDRFTTIPSTPSTGQPITVSPALVMKDSNGNITLTETKGNIYII